MIPMELSFPAIVALTLFVVAVVALRIFYGQKRLVKKNRQFWTGDEDTKVRDFAKRRIMVFGDEVLEDNKLAVMRNLKRLKAARLSTMAKLKRAPKKIGKLSKEIKEDLKGAPKKLQKLSKELKEDLKDAPKKLQKLSAELKHDLKHAPGRIKKYHQELKDFAKITKNTPDADGLDNIHVPLFTPRTQSRTSQSQPEHGHQKEIHVLAHEILSQSPLVTILSSTELYSACQLAEKVTLRRKHCLYSSDAQTEGTERRSLSSGLFDSNLYLLVSGNLEVRVKGQLWDTRSKPGMVSSPLGWLSWAMMGEDPSLAAKLEERCSPVNVIAADDCVLLCIPEFGQRLQSLSQEVTRRMMLQNLFRVNFNLKIMHIYLGMSDVGTQLHVMSSLSEAEVESSPDEASASSSSSSTTTTTSTTSTLEEQVHKLVCSSLGIDINRTLPAVVDLKRASAAKATLRSDSVEYDRGSSGCGGGGDSSGRAGGDDDAEDDDVAREARSAWFDELRRHEHHLQVVRLEAGQWLSDLSTSPAAYIVRSTTSGENAAKKKKGDDGTNTKSGDGDGGKLQLEARKWNGQRERVGTTLKQGDMLGVLPLLTSSFKDWFGGSSSSDSGGGGSDGGSSTSGEPGWLAHLSARNVGTSAVELVRIPQVCFSGLLSGRGGYKVLRHLTSKVLHAVLETTLLTQFDYVTELQLLHSGSTLVSQGEDCRRLYTVLHGRLRAFQGGGHGGDSGTAEVVGAGTVGGVRAESGSSGRGTLFAEFSRGRVVGIVEVAIQQPWQCTLVAARDSRIFQVPVNAIQAVAHNKPEVMAHFGQVSCLHTVSYFRLNRDKTAGAGPFRADTRALGDHYFTRPANLVAGMLGAGLALGGAGGSSNKSAIRSVSPSFTPHIIALVPVSDSVPTARFTEMLQAALTQHCKRSCIMIHPGVVAKAVGLGGSDGGPTTGDAPKGEAASPRARTRSTSRGKQQQQQLVEEHLEAGSMTIINWLEAQEEAHKVVLYTCDDYDSAWTRQSVKHADVVLLIGNASEPPCPDLDVLKLLYAPSGGAEGLSSETGAPIATAASARKELVLLHLDHGDTGGARGFGYGFGGYGGQSGGGVDTEYSPRGTREWLAAFAAFKDRVDWDGVGGGGGGEGIAVGVQHHHHVSIGLDFFSEDYRYNNSTLLRAAGSSTGGAGSATSAPDGASGGGGRESEGLRSSFMQNRATSLSMDGGLTRSLSLDFDSHRNALKLQQQQKRSGDNTSNSNSSNHSKKGLSVDDQGFGGGGGASGCGSVAVGRRGRSRSGRVTFQDHPPSRPSSSSSLSSSTSVDLNRDVARLARRLSGCAVGLVLGGGGARGGAHVGILRAMEEEGVPVDAIGGTSIGSLVGAVYAKEGSAGHPVLRAKRVLQRYLRMSRNVWNFVFDLTLPLVSYFGGRSFNRSVVACLADSKIEDYWIPYFCNTTDLSRSEERVHTNGTAWRYVRASMSLTPHLPPLCDREKKPRSLTDRYIKGTKPLAAKESTTTMAQAQVHGKRQLPLAPPAAAAGVGTPLVRNARSGSGHEELQKVRQKQQEELREQKRRRKNQKAYAQSGDGAGEQQDTMVHYLCDGGYMNNVPTQALVAMLPMGGSIIACDIGSVVELGGYDYNATLSGWWVLWQRYSPWRKGPPPNVPSMNEIAAQLAYTCSEVKRREARDMADVFLRPPIAGVGVLDWNSWGAVEEAGYLYGKEQMRKWKAELIRTNDPRGEIFK